MNHFHKTNGAFGWTWMKEALHLIDLLNVQHEIYRMIVLGVQEKQTAPTFYLEEGPVYVTIWKNRPGNPEGWRMAPVPVLAIHKPSLRIHRTNTSGRVSIEITYGNLFEVNDRAWFKLPPTKYSEIGAHWGMKS